MIRSVAFLLALVTAAAAPAGLTNINLEWRPVAQTVMVGDTVNIGLFAVCDPGESQVMRAADIIFTWDPSVLLFLGIDNAATGTAPALSSTLPANDPYNLNGPTVPPVDGDGYYRWWSTLGVPLSVDDAGVLLTTFQFSALAVTQATTVGLATSGGSPYVLSTRIYGGPEAGMIVTGTLGTAMVTITAIPEPAGVTLGLIGLSVAGLRRR